MHFFLIPFIGIIFKTILILHYVVLDIAEQLLEFVGKSLKSYEWLKFVVPTSRLTLHIRLKLI